MIMYNYSKARQNLASLLNLASRDGEARIQRKDGSIFIVKPEKKSKSPLDIKGIDLNITTKEIVKCIRDIRKKT